MKIKNRPIKTQHSKDIRKKFGLNNGLRKIIKKKHFSSRAQLKNSNLIQMIFLKAEERSLEQKRTLVIFKNKKKSDWI